MTVTAGFLLASNGKVNFLVLLTTLLGSSLMIASGCVFNNYLDRGIDEKMERTKKRALVVHSISRRAALIYGLILGFLGFLILAVYTNILIVVVGLAGLISYVVVYGIVKRRSVHGTLVGSFSGAIPPLAGYTAAVNMIDTVAVILFFNLVVWQMPHFYSIAIFRSKEYAAAKIPVLPLEKGLNATKKQMVIYIIGFIAVSSLLTAVNATGWVYLFGMILISLWWLRLGFRGFKTNDNNLWARQMFKRSLAVITVFSLLLSFNSFLP